MTRKVMGAGILALALASAMSAHGAASGAGSDPQYTQAQLKTMQQNAHTAEQYSALASYYDKQQKNYLDQAAAEKKEWIRRSQFVVATGAKYPRPVDSARYLYEYYTYKASAAGELSAKYSQSASPEVLAKVQ